MNGNAGDLAARLCATYSAFFPKAVAGDDRRFRLIQFDVSTIFVRLHRPLFVIVTTYDALVAALEGDDLWLHEILVDILPRTSERTDLVPIVASDPGDRKLAKQLLDKQQFGRDCPLIGSERLLSKETSRQPKDSLRAALLKSAPIYALSPYRIDTFAPTEMLVGREQVLADVRQSQSDKLIITGPRRIGKTSVAKAIQKAAGQLPQRRGHFGGGGAAISRCSYVDVSELGERTSSKLLWLEILHKFNLTPRDYAAGGRLVAVGRNVRRRIDASGEQFDEAKALLAFVLQNPGELTIILDEVDSWIDREAETGWRTLEQLRAITDQGRAKVILVGYESLLLAAESHRFPLAGRGTRNIQLGPIERSAVEDLVLRPMRELGVSLSQQDEFFNRLWEATSGMPHLVQDICHHVVDICLGGGRKQARVGLRELENAIDWSDAVQNYRLAVQNATDFPLAAAVAGICSLAGPGELPEGEAEDDSSETKTVTVGEIARRLEELTDGRYSYNHDEFRLALAYLELRFILRPLERTKTRWMWRNQMARKDTARAIQNIGAKRWMIDMIELHNSGSWRRRYLIFGKRRA